MSHRALLAGVMLLRAAAAWAQGTGEVAGIVRASGAPAAGAEVLVGGDDTMTAITDSAGRFELPIVPAGVYRVTAARAGWTPGAASVTVVAGERVSVEISLGRVTTLATVDVIAREKAPYGEASASGATKIAVPLLDLPQDVAVVPRAVIDDRSITDVRALTRNVSGVEVNPGIAGSALNEVNFVFRGVPSTGYANGSLRDGFRDFALFTPRDMVDVDRVEFLKGPASVMYGAVGAIGGMANFISKQPLAERGGELTFSADAFGGLRATADLGGPLAESGALLYRLDLAGELVRNFRQFSTGTGFAIAPAVTWSPSAATTLQFRAEFTEHRFRDDPFLPLYDGVFALPTSRYYGEPAQPRDVGLGAVGQVILTHRLSPALVLREGLSYIAGQLSDFGYAFAGVDSLGPTLERFYGTSVDVSNNFASQTELVADLSSGALRQRLVAGLELSAERLSHWDTGDTLAAIDIPSPVYGAVPTDTGQRSEVRTETRQAGLYAQDLIDIGAAVKVVVGARYDITSTALTSSGSYWGAIGDAQQHGHHLTPRAGIVYQPTATMSLYASWSRSFMPNVNYPSHGETAPFPPELGEQFEVGVKREWGSGRFGATLAAYQLTKHNLLIQDPTDTHFPPRSIAIGLQHGRGIELDASGSLTRELSVVIAYAYVESMVAPDVWLPNGTAFPNQPRSRGSVWAKYVPPTPALRGVALGLGVTAATAQYANYDDPMRLPGSVLFDAMVSYSARWYTVQVNAENLSDVRTYLGNGGALEPGAPRSVRATVAYRW